MVIALSLAIPGARFLLSPLRNRRGGRSDDFLRVAPLSALPVASDAAPVRVTVSRDRWDAYAHFPAEPVGAVWLVPDHGADANAGADEDGAPRVRCFQAMCPHLGCGIDYSARRRAFYCPCHESDFDAAGHRRSGPSPRDMDELACRVSQPDATGERWIEVRYQVFATGSSTPRPLA